MTPPRTPSLPPEIRRQVDGALRPGEKLVWAGQPLPHLHARGAAILVPFGILWTGVTTYMFTRGGWGDNGIFVRGSNHGLLVALMLGLFVAVGIAMITSPIWMRAEARRTVYAVTDQRAITISGKAWGGVKTVSYLPERLTSMTRNQRSDGTGDLIFEEFQERVGSGTTTVRRGFVAIANVKQVEDLITSTLLADRARAIEG